MDEGESDLPSFAETQGKEDFRSTFRNSYNDAVEDFSSKEHEERHKNLDRLDSWTDCHQSEPKDDLDIILPAIDTTDSAIGNDYFIASLGGTDKPIENGVAPLLDEDGHALPIPEQTSPQDAGCAVDCMYYTLMCCECSIM